jgi:hypothetical protein
VQATLTTYLRNHGYCVYLYEAGGGYIFPEILNLHIDYWETSPASHIESQAKILCLEKLKNFDQDLTDRVISTFRNQTSIPFGLDYLTKTSPKFDEVRLGMANNYAFFASSRFEFSILHKPGSEAQFFQNQIDAVRSILGKLSANDKLFIRLHPSDPNMPTQHDYEWDIFKTNSQIEIIDSDNRLNSYSLAKSMRANFVWASTLGYEFAVANIPVAVMSETAAYAPCMEEICVFEEESLKRFLVNPILPKFESLLSYANYLARGGFQLETSREEPGRRIFLFGEQVDVYKKVFNLLPERIRISIT